jgi:hypothetical protein
MRKALICLVPVAALVVFVLVGAAVSPQSASSSSPVGNKVLAHKLAVELGREPARAKEMPVSSGVMYTLLERTGVINQRTAKWARTAQGRAALNRSGISSQKTQGCQNVFHGHGRKNTRVNQDCSFRRQAEETIQLNPLNEKNIIAGQNDSRIGFNHCGYDWSFDGGKSWGDQVPPFWQFVLVDGHTADACSDPTSAWDSRANAYAGGVLFDVASGANAVVVMKSNAGNGGAFYHSPNPAGGFQEYRDTPVGVVANDDGEVFFNDKELMTADAHASSPKRDNVYMTWTRFEDQPPPGPGGNDRSPIVFSQSTDGGATWSPAIFISGNNPAVCTDFSVGPGDCDQDQGSDPVVGPDGTIYVVFGNGNTPGVGINQVLVVKCPAANNCASASGWTAPVKVGDLIDNHPTGPLPNGDPVSGCPPNRQCLPPNGYRVPEFTSMSISVDLNGKLFIVWSDFRNGGPPCTGSTTTATPPCDNDVFYAFSLNGGATWSATRNITPASRFGVNAQWQPWSEVTTDGSRLWVAYYDRSYGNCENTGCNDITAAEIRNPATASPSIDYERVTTGSMPNLTPATNPVQAGFLGDYMWVDTDRHGDAHIVWADTRPIRGTAPEEDVYYAEVHRNRGR